MSKRKTTIKKTAVKKTTAKKPVHKTAAAKQPARKQQTKSTTQKRSSRTTSNDAKNSRRIRIQTPAYRRNMTDGERFGLMTEHLIQGALSLRPTRDSENLDDAIFNLFHAATALLEQSGGTRDDLMDMLASCEEIFDNHTDDGEAHHCAECEAEAKAESDAAANSETERAAAEKRNLMN